MKRNKFSLSHYKLCTMDMGKLIPISWFETLPGDTIQQTSATLIRMAPMEAPIMHPVMARIHHWFVPLRLIWEDFEDFITGGDDGTFTATVPQFNSPTVAEGDLLDYMGLPPASYSSDHVVSALPARAYNLIYNHHYRDQDLVTEISISTASGADSTTPVDILNCAWEKDYFTTARPWTQKGSDISIPLGPNAPVTGIGVKPGAVSGTTSWSETGATDISSVAGFKSEETDEYFRMKEDPSNSGYPYIHADLSNAGISIDDLRLSLALQKYQEARARYGSRYVEYLKYLGVQPSDARLQLPQYLGGGRQVLQVSEVLQTDTNVGSMYGHGIGALRTNRYRRFFEEHGIVMTLMSVVPKAIYSDAMYRGWSRETKEEYFQKELQFIGEQEILNREIQVDRSTGLNSVFGYQSRYDEYRHIPSNIAGEFRSTLDHWHLARIFGSDVSLNSSFINCTPSKRIFSAPSTDCLYVMANHSIQARRMMAKFGVPKV